MATPAALLHPVRLRVVQALLGGRALTTNQIADELPDVPKPTLYRHIAALTEARILVISSERPIRGTVERTYRLDEENAEADAIDAADMGEQERRSSFAVFTAGLVAAFEAALARDPGSGSQPFGYRTAALHVPPEDMDDFVGRVQDAVAPWREPSTGGQRYLFSTVLIPATTAAP